MQSKVEETRLKYLFSAILELQTLEECNRFFEDLCTVPELKALSQRIEVAKMLSENSVYSDIVKKTGASTATISRVNRSLNHHSTGGYSLVFDRLKDKEDGGV